MNMYEFDQRSLDAKIRWLLLELKNSVTDSCLKSGIINAEEWRKRCEDNFDKIILNKK